MYNISVVIRCQRIVYTRSALMWNALRPRSVEINSNNKNNLSLANYEQIFMYIWRLYNFMSHEHEYVCNVKMKCPTILDAYITSRHTGKAFVKNMKWIFFSFVNPMSTFFFFGKCQVVRLQMRSYDLGLKPKWCASSVLTYCQCRKSCVIRALMWFRFMLRRVCIKCVAAKACYYQQSISRRAAIQ